MAGSGSIAESDEEWTSVNAPDNYEVQSSVDDARIDKKREDEAPASSHNEMDYSETNSDASATPLWLIEAEDSLFKVSNESVEEAENVRTEQAADDERIAGATTGEAPVSATRSRPDAAPSRLLMELGLPLVVFIVVSLVCCLTIGPDRHTPSSTSHSANTSVQSAATPLALPLAHMQLMHLLNRCRANQKEVTSRMHVEMHRLRAEKANDHRVLAEKLGKAQDELRAATVTLRKNMKFEADDRVSRCPTLKEENERMLEKAKLAAATAVRAADASEKERRREREGWKWRLREQKRQLDEARRELQRLKESSGGGAAEANTRGGGRAPRSTRSGAHNGPRGTKIKIEKSEPAAEKQHDKSRTSTADGAQDTEYRRRPHFRCDSSWKGSSCSSSEGPFEAEDVFMRVVPFLPFLHPLATLLFA